MLEPSDLYAAVNRLLIGLGQIITAAALLAVVAVLAAQTGNLHARDSAILALSLTTAGYALQLTRLTSILSGLMLACVGASWAAGGAAVAFLIFRSI